MKRDILNKKIGFLEIIDIMPQQRKELQEKLHQRIKYIYCISCIIFVVSEIF